MNKLKSCDIDAMDLRMIQNLYWKQTASIKLEEGESDSSAIKRGVRQGCILSPKLFNLHVFFYKKLVYKKRVLHW